MRDPDTFDEFYKATRGRLLLQAYALTGDLPASRSAVRDAFVVAGHHWRKVSRREDPEAWVRPVAWAHAHRRRTARLWHRDKSLDPAVRATLDALGKLTGVQRRILLLTHLASGSMEDFAREIGITQDAAERELQSATAQFAVNRDVGSTEVRTLLTDLSQVTDAVTFPRPTIVRRAGTARRRVHAAVGSAAVVAVLLGAGTFVTDGRGVSPSLAGEEIMTTPAGKPKEELAGQPVLDVADLLTPEQVRRLAPGQAWTKPSTTDNTAGKGINLPCQQARFADPDGLGAFVRRLRTAEPTSAKAKRLVAVASTQTTELSRSEDSAHAAYTTALSWFAGCTDPRTQLLSTQTLRGVGDEAVLVTLRRWTEPVTTFAVGLARTGQVTTTTVSQLEAARPPQVREVTSLTAAAVNRLCGSPGAGTCAAPPKAVDLAPPAVGETPGLIQIVDLPLARGAKQPWAGAPVQEARQNPATWQCDNADFNQKSMTSNVTQTFVIVGNKDFGLVETAAALPKDPNARGFVNLMRGRLGGCEEKVQGTEVETLTDVRRKGVDLVAWRLTTKLSDRRSVEFLMAFVRNGNRVAQLTVNLDPDARVDEPSFLALAERARQRLAYLG